MGDNEQPGLAKVSGREKPVAELTCGIVQLDHSSWDLQSQARVWRSQNITLLKAFK